MTFTLPLKTPTVTDPMWATDEYAITIFETILCKKVQEGREEFAQYWPLSS